MFTPSQHDVRLFFCEAHQRQRDGAPLTPMQARAADWIALHPEYHADLADPAAAQAAVYDVEAGRTNPFLHLSMHVSIVSRSASTSRAASSRPSSCSRPGAARCTRPSTR